MAAPTIDAGALTSVANLHRHLEIADATTTWDAILIDLINGVSAAIETYCCRKLKLQSTVSYTEYFDGQGGEAVTVKNRPITSVTSVHDDPYQSYSADTLVDPTSYTIYNNEGRIELINDDNRSIVSKGLFYDGKNNVKVIYKAGYTTIPYDIEQAANKWVMKLFRQREKEGIASERLGAYSVSYQDLKDIPADIKNMIDPYVNINV